MCGGVGLYERNKKIGGGAEVDRKERQRMENTEGNGCLKLENTMFINWVHILHVRL